jgi:hypothetical protein
VRPPTQVLAAAGAVNHDELVKLASDAFGSVPDEDPATSVRSLLVKVGGRRRRRGRGSGLRRVGRGSGLRRVGRNQAQYLTATAA